MGQSEYPLHGKRGCFSGRNEKRSSKCSPEIEYREGLREINLGSWEGRSFEEIRQKYPLEYKERGEKLSSYRIQGGETFEEVQARAVETLREILREPEKKHVLITHLGVMRTLNCWIEKIPLDRLMEKKWDYAEMLLLSADDTERIRRGL